MNLPLHTHFLTRILAFITAAFLFPSFSHASCEKLADSESYSKKRQAVMFLVEGTDGYLFISKKDMIPDFSIDPALIDYASRFTQTMEENGIHVVMVIQPPRGLVHQDKIPAALQKKYGFNPVASRSSFTNMIETLRSKGFTVATLPNIAMQDYALKRDHHWTAAGAKAIAEDIAMRVKELPFYANIPKTEFETDAGKKNNKFKGSLANAYKEICKSDLGPETITEYTTGPASSSSSTEEDSLFGDTPSPSVVLAGTSFSSNEAAHANFDGWLKESLSTDVLNYAVRGGGFNSGVLSYLASDDYKNRKQSILVWEMPAYLKFGSEGDWRELVAAPYGDCKGTSREVLSSELTLSDKRTPLFSEKELSSLKPEPSKGFLSALLDKFSGNKDEEFGKNRLYLFMSFKSVPKGDIKIKALKAKQKIWHFPIEHSSRLGENLPYYVDLGIVGDFDSLELGTGDKDTGLSGEVRICHYR